VREAFYFAIDAHGLKKGTMRGQASPTACMTTAPVGCLAAELETGEQADMVRARRLMAVAAMLGRIGVKVHVKTQPKTIYFQEDPRSRYQLLHAGLGRRQRRCQDHVGPDPAQPRRADGEGRRQPRPLPRDEELDRLIDAAGVEINTARRAGLIAEALRRTHRHFYYLPVHRQMLTWVSRANVHPVVMPDNEVHVHWIRID